MRHHRRRPDAEHLRDREHEKRQVGADADRRHGVGAQAPDPEQIDQHVQRLEDHAHEHEAGGLDQVAGERSGGEVLHGASANYTWQNERGSFLIGDIRIVLSWLPPRERWRWLAARADRGPGRAHRGGRRARRVRAAAAGRRSRAGAHRAGRVGNLAGVAERRSAPDRRGPGARRRAPSTSGARAFLSWADWVKLGRGVTARRRRPPSGCSPGISRPIICFTSGAARPR